MYKKQNDLKRERSNSLNIKKYIELNQLLFELAHLINLRDTVYPLNFSIEIIIAIAPSLNLYVSIATALYIRRKQGHCPARAIKMQSVCRR